MDELGADEIAKVDEWVAKAKAGATVKLKNTFADRTPLYIAELLARGGTCDEHTNDLVNFGAGRIWIAE